MRLKIFIFPLLLVIIFFLGFNFIKPDVDAVLAQRKAIDQSRAKLSAIESKLANVDALASSMDPGGVSASKADFLRSYLPEAIDQERLADQINYVAVTSGVILDAISFEKPKAVQKPSALKPDPDEAVDEEGLPAPTFPEPESIEARVIVQATYDGLRQFASGIDKLKQLNAVTSMRVERVEEQGEAGAAPVQTGMLGIEMTVEFYAMARKNMPQAYLLPVFDEETYAFPGYADIPASDGYVPIEPSAPGRQNIFIR